MKKKTILVVEDEKGMRESLQEILESSGYAVVPAEDGEEAIELIGKQKIDLVLLDIILPRKDGFEVLKELKGDEKTKEIPVVLATNLSDPKDIQKALDYGATTYLVKSNYSLEDIVAKVSEVIG
ncbi:MAG: response regulator [Patescibacteria group bacterium]|nr:response regulator [Patescibacteria group bacterium]